MRKRQLREKRRNLYRKWYFTVYVHMCVYTYTAYRIILTVDLCGQTLLNFTVARTFHGHSLYMVHIYKFFLGNFLKIPGHIPLETNRIRITWLSFTAAYFLKLSQSPFRETILPPPDWKVILLHLSVNLMWSFCALRRRPYSRAVSSPAAYPLHPVSGSMIQSHIRYKCMENRVSSFDHERRYHIMQSIDRWWWSGKREIRCSKEHIPVSIRSSIYL